MAGITLAFVLVVAVGIFFWLFPIIIILFSGKTSGREKLAWILAAIFISWFAWIFYLLLAPLSERRD